MQLVTTQDQLADVCRALREAGAFGVDTEFVQERTFFVRLGVIQVAAPDVEAVIDPEATGALDPLLDLIHDPKIEKIVHAGRKDFEIFFERSGAAPRNIFDCQIAAAFVGYGYQISLAGLMQRALGLKISKLETLTDWTRRPLTDRQLEYAVEDVRHLTALRDHLMAALDSLGRADWAREECRSLEDTSLYAQREPDEAYLRVKGRGFDARTLGVLRELAAWREKEAIERDVPRSTMMRDDVLVEIARRAPKTLQALRDIRLLRQNIGEARGLKILEAVERGRANPVRRERGPAPPPEPPPQAASFVRLLEAWMRARAMEEKIAPEMLATRSDLDDLCALTLAGKEADVGVMRGWRRELVGQDLLDLLEGKMRLGIDPRRAALVAERVERAERPKEARGAKAENSARDAAP